MAPNGNVCELSFEPVHHLINGLVLLHHIRYDSLKTPNGAMSMSSEFMAAGCSTSLKFITVNIFLFVRNFITVNYKSVVFESVRP
jgi:hypothetical protein